MATSLLALFCVLCVFAVGASAQGWWQCTVTHTAYFTVPEVWTCTLSENCCLTGSRLTTTGCCKDMVDESVFTSHPGYQQCSPARARNYYCPSSRDCCTVARSGGGNETGCCISQDAADTTASSSQAKHFKNGVEEQEENKEEDQPKIHRRLSTGTIMIIALIPIVFCVVTVVSIAYYCQLKKSRDLRRQRGMRRAQLQAAALGLPIATGSDGTVNLGSYEANGIAPPTYWETVREDSTTPPPPAVTTSQGTHRGPPGSGNIQYARLQNEEDDK